MYTVKYGFFCQIRRSLITITIFLYPIILALSLPCPTRADSVIRYAGHCDIEFCGTSNLHDFSGTVTSRPFEIIATPSDDLYEILRTTEVEVEIKKMDTGIGLMNKNMYKMFEADTYPLITGTIADSPQNAAIAAIGIAPGESLPLAITLHGKTNTVNAAIEDVTQEKDGTTVITGVFDLSLTAYGIEPPTFFFIFKVGDTVHLRVKVVTCPATPQGQPADQSADKQSVTPPGPTS
jgi:hypothetical protein